MGSIPAWLLRHTVHIEPFEGDGPYGPEYGEQTTVACFVDDRLQKILNAEGAEIVARGVLYMPLDTVSPVGSRVTVNGRAALVLAALRRDGGGLPTPDHLEVALQ
ncbi:hypothetical protein ITP53_39405 [Nonomuraea sp. K274]|uniref:Head-to-tail stopper n=1 Tax=Nonomuraea cypriaca TaxID=1187855 RepID=A0A931F519_9ACTN|nr:hypothetical protein [Nonomuraea cypriaca]MBF8191661.1 hypothetical protein [Nonomuraea cypriaca]